MGPRRRFSAVLAALSLLMLLVGTALPAVVAAKGSGPAMVGRAVSFYTSRPAREVARSQPAQTQSRPAPARRNPLADEPDQGRRGTWDRGPAPADALAGRTGAKSVAPPPSLSFDGTGSQTGCGGCQPPDTTGDVGPSHYVQMVNATKVAIYNKTGTPLAVPFDLGLLWPVSDLCRANDGDPNVLYDSRADRWMLSQFVAIQGQALCFAVSTTSDPTGTYNVFRFTTSATAGDFPDYFKVGIGPDAYFVGTNESLGSGYSAYAFDRTKMLAGDATANFVKFGGGTNFLMPADLDGPNAFLGTAGYFYTFKDNTFHGGVDRIEVFQLDPDFVTPANSTFTGPTTFPIAAFTYTPCGFSNLDCVNQLGASASARLDAIGEWPMQHLVYRNFGTHETLLGNFTIGTAPNGPGGTGEVGAAPRWFELRRVGAGAWTLFQEGTYDPADGNDRFMGSIAMDGAGNIALGYSVSSSAIHPAIRYATRAPGDPLGTLGAEQVLINGAGSQTSSASRWGDYSSMVIDPSDDCTFWYTNEYYAVNSTSLWSTRIGAFRPSCPVGLPTISVDDVTHNEGNSGTTVYTFTLSLSAANPSGASVDVKTTDGSATSPSDYTAILHTTTLTFGPTETSKTVTVNVNGDTAEEPDEAFAVDLSSASGATIADGHGLGTITNDDGLPPPVRKPDGRIRKGSGTFVGNNIYNTTGVNQTRTGSAARGSTITFGISIQNDAITGADSFKVLATGTASTMYNVRYFRGTTEITAAVVAGTYTTPSLAPGATYLITAKVKVKSSATVGSSVTRLVTISSVGNSAQKDAVKFIGKRA